MLKIFNTLTRRKEVFKPIKRTVRVYTCGPSVYSRPHLGNFRTYVFEDVVKRVLIFEGYKVKHVMNITDIEDKMVRAAKGSMGELKRITKNNERVFMRNSNNLNLLPADCYPHATESIGEMVKLIKKLMRRGLAYKDERGNIFLDVSNFPSYGKLSRSKFKHKLNGRVYKDDYYQGEAGDFILWKAWRKSDGDIFWDTELERGRPGWHIECSAMSLRYLGLPFDIHLGGIDNIFAHHENEIAQSEGATGKMPANYWMYVRHLLLEDRKMSKSLGNVYDVDGIHRMGYGYNTIRAHLLEEHYRKRLNFTFKGLRRTANELKRCRSCANSLKRERFWEENPKVDELIKNSLSEFTVDIEDDFDIPKAMETFCSFRRKVEELIRKRKFGRRNAKRALEAMRKMDFVLGFIY